jgi:tetratricopeptide (TPR) repeat protein
MNTTMTKLIGLFAAITLVGCATTASSTASRSSGDEDDRPAPATGKPGGTKNAGGKGAPASEQVATQPQVNGKAKLLFEDANKAYDNQKKGGKLDYAALAQKYQSAANADERLAEATYNLGVLAERQGKLKDAVGYYKEALSKKPSLKQAAENLAVIAQNQGDEAGAVGIYQDILTRFPDDASSRARLAEIYRRKGECEKGVELAKESLFREPHTLQAYKVLMLCAYEQKQFSMAKLVALRASKIDDNDPEIFFTLGQINLLEKEPAKARVQFKKAVEARPDFLPAHLQLAKMAMDQEDYTSAEESIRRILGANGNNPEALVNLGVAYKGLGQYDKAMAAYDAAQKIKPDMPEIYLNRGFILAVKAQPEKAIEYYKQYVQMKGGDGALPRNHAVFDAIKDQEAVIAHREEDKKAAEEAAKMEAEAKKAEDAAKAEEKKQKEEELKKTQAEAKGNVSKDAAKGADTGEPKSEGKEKAKPPDDPKKAPKKAEPVKPAPAPVPAKAAPKNDEPSDAL